MSRALRQRLETLQQEAASLREQLAAHGPQVADAVLEAEALESEWLLLEADRDAARARTRALAKESKRLTDNLPTADASRAAEAVAMLFAGGSLLAIVMLVLFLRLM